MKKTAKNKGKNNKTNRHGNTLKTLYFLPVANPENNEDIQPKKLTDVVLIHYKKGRLFSVDHEGNHNQVKGINTLTELVTMLDQKHFVQVNRNCVVRLDKVVNVMKYSNKQYRISISDGSEFRLPRKRMVELLKKYIWSMKIFNS